MSLTITNGFASAVSAREASGSHLPERLSLAVGGLFRLIGRQVALRRARRELLGMPDYMLADMGISRSEIASVVRYGAPDPTRLARGRL